MTILGMNGAPLPGAKKDHHPERVGKERVRLSNLYAEQLKRWEADNQPDPMGATTPNHAAIDEYHAQQWRTIALAARQSQEALEVNPERMAEHIAEHRRREAKRADQLLPMKDVHDLEPWGFRLVGQCRFGAVWLCDVVALAIAEDGMVLLDMRSPRADAALWAAGAYEPWLSDARWSGARELPDYTLLELFSLLKALRYTKVSVLPEGLMALARGGEGLSDAARADAAELRDQVAHPTKG